MIAVAVRMGKRPAEVMDWTEAEVALCLAFMRDVTGELVLLPGVHERRQRGTGATSQQMAERGL